MGQAVQPTRRNAKPCSRGTDGPLGHASWQVDTLARGAVCYSAGKWIQSAVCSRGLDWAPTPTHGYKPAARNTYRQSVDTYRHIGTVLPWCGGAALDGFYTRAISSAGLVPISFAWRVSIASAGLVSIASAGLVSMCISRFYTASTPGQISLQTRTGYVAATLLRPIPLQPHSLPASYRPGSECGPVPGPVRGAKAGAPRPRSRPG